MKDKVYRTENRKQSFVYAGLSSSHNCADILPFLEYWLEIIRRLSTKLQMNKLANLPRAEAETS